MICVESVSDRGGGALGANQHFVGASARVAPPLYSPLVTTELSEAAVEMEGIHKFSIFFTTYKHNCMLVEEVGVGRGARLAFHSCYFIGAGHATDCVLSELIFPSLQSTRLSRRDDIGNPRRRVIQSLIQ